MNFFDRLTIDASTRRRTGDGYLMVTGKIARTGIQEYSGAEVGRPDLKTVKVYRDESQVFDEKALASFAHRPVTNDHPPESVNAKNWRQYSVGYIGDKVVRDGEEISVPFVIMDEATINSVEDGKAELSAGYACDLVFESGETADGLKFDAKQTNIRANHLAIVDRARGGPTLRIGDDAMTDPVIKLKTITVDGLPFEVNDAAATIIAKLQTDLSAANQKVTDGAAALAKAATDHATALAAKDAEITALKTKIPDAAAIDAMVKAKETTVTIAKKLIGDGFKADGLSVEDIHKAVVTAKMGEAVKAYTPEQFKVAFDTLSTYAPGAARPDPVRQVVQSGVIDASDPAAAALAAENKRIADAWKAPTSQQH